MTAFVSGQAGAALIVDDGTIRSLHYPEIDRVRERTEAEAAILLLGYDDVRELSGVSLEEAKKELELECGKDRALQLALILLDSDAAEQTRTLAAECLDERLGTAPIRRFVENRLYAMPLPKSVDVARTLELSLEYLAAFDLVHRVADDQGEIHRVRKVWDGLPDVLFGSSDRKKKACFFAIEAGMFFSLARPQDLRPFDSELSKYRMDSELRDALGKAWQSCHNELGKRVYIVKAGDSLWKVAQAYFGDGKLYPKIIVANPERFKDGESTIREGERLVVPH